MAREASAASLELSERGGTTREPREASAASLELSERGGTTREPREASAASLELSERGGTTRSPHRLPERGAEESRYRLGDLRVLPDEEVVRR